MLEEFKNYLTLNVSSSRTVETYMFTMGDYFSKYKIFNQQYVNSYIQNMIEEELSANYINKCMAVLKKYAMFLKIVLEFPKNRKKTESQKISLTLDEIENEIFPYFVTMFQDYKKRMLVFRFLVTSCLRISELNNLKKKDINFDTGVIDIVGKGSKRRKAYVHPDILDDLKSLVSESKTESALDISEHYVSYMLDCINTQLNYKKHITPHTLRHSGARILRSQGVPIENIKKILGHANLNTTYIYLSVDDEEIQESFNLTQFIRKGKKNA